MHYAGDYVAKNASVAFEYYTMAAKLQNAPALNALGLMHEDGIGCDQDLSVAAECFRDAAELGDANGNFNLALLFSGGLGVNMDHRKALKHFREVSTSQFKRISYLEYRRNVWVTPKQHRVLPSCQIRSDMA